MSVDIASLQDWSAHTPPPQKPSPGHSFRSRGAPTRVWPTLLKSYPGKKVTAAGRQLGALTGDSSVLGIWSMVLKGQRALGRHVPSVLRTRPREKGYSRRRGIPIMWGVQIRDLFCPGLRVALQRPARVSLWSGLTMSPRNAQQGECLMQQEMGTSLSVILTEGSCWPQCWPCGILPWDSVKTNYRKARISVFGLRSVGGEREGGKVSSEVTGLPSAGPKLPSSVYSYLQSSPSCGCSSACSLPRRLGTPFLSGTDRPALCAALASCFSLTGVGAPERPRNSKGENDGYVN